MRRVSRRHVDPVTGIRYATEADKHRAQRERETQRANEASRAAGATYLGELRSRAFAQQEIEAANRRRILNEG
jgi:hypothetical protein